MVEPVDAATIILVRPWADGWETFMVRRHVGSEFAADVFVFPGGKVDPGDRELPPSLLHGGEGLNDVEIALRVAAIRETWEEARVLIARGTLDAEALARLRAQMDKGTTGWAEVLEVIGARLDLQALTPFSHWITPEDSPRRYDTWFFVAQVPSGQEPEHDRIETTAGTWISPEAALALAARDEFPLVFPTRKHLERMARFSTIDDLLGGVTAADLEAVMPRIVQRGGEAVFLLPGEQGYEEAGTNS